MKFTKKAALILALLMLCGCGAQAKKSNGKFVVYTSFAVMEDFAGRLCTDETEVRQLVPSGAEPHDWEPSPKDMAGMADADLIVINGMGMEGWADKVRKSLPNAKFVVLSDGIAGFKDMDHDHDHSDDGHAHDHGGIDPHVWLNPMHAVTEVRNLRDALIAMDPENEALYNERFAVFEQEAIALDAEFTAALSGSAQKSIVVSHEAYGYLCEAYGLTQIPIEGLFADGEPSPTKIAEIIEFVKSNQIEYIFFEELLPSKALDTIAAGTGVKTLLLSPLEYIGDGEDYFSVMRMNLKNLSEALRP